MRVKFANFMLYSMKHRCFANQIVPRSFSPQTISKWIETSHRKFYRHAPENRFGWQTVTDSSGTCIFHLSKCTRAIIRFSTVSSCLRMIGFWFPGNAIRCSGEIMVFFLLSFSHRNRRRRELHFRRLPDIAVLCAVCSRRWNWTFRLFLLIQLFSFYFELLYFLSLIYTLVC